MTRKTPHTVTEADEPLDPVLDPLLDEALQPGDLPEGLVDRIVAATRHELTKRQTPPRSVLARIGPRRWYALAAMLMLAAIVSVSYVATGVRPADPGTQPGGKVVADSALVREMAILAAYQPPDEELDQDIQLLAMDFDLIQQTGDLLAGTEEDELAEWSATDADWETESTTYDGQDGSLF